MLPDNRIVLTGPLIDFVNNVGVTGQDHDSYPAADQQARFDTMRSYLIGLLSNQSSYTAPTQFREGTIWFDLNTAVLRIYHNGSWRPLADAIALIDQTGTTDLLTLSQWFESLSGYLATFGPEMVFSGQATQTTSSIPIPVDLRASVTATYQALIWVNGLLKDPRLSMISSGVISLGFNLNASDTFVVQLKNYLPQNFYRTAVMVP